MQNCINEIKRKNILNEIHRTEQTKINMHLYIIHLYDTNAQYYSISSYKKVADVTHCEQ